MAGRRALVTSLDLGLPQLVVLPPPGKAEIQYRRPTGPGTLGS